MSEIEKKEEDISIIRGVIDNWAKKAVSANKFDGASVYNPYNSKELAIALVNAGYGDVKQAVNEFAEKVFNCLKGYNLSYFDGEYVRPFDEYKIARIIYGIKKEICGE